MLNHVRVQLVVRFVLPDEDTVQVLQDVLKRAKRPGIQFDSSDDSTRLPSQFPEPSAVLYRHIARAGRGMSNIARTRPGLGLYTMTRLDQVSWRSSRVLNSCAQAV